MYRYEDKGINIWWNLEDGERTIEGYQCKKATCTHRGRSYVAWYAPALAMGDGPYVFGGQPGLILELYDTRDHYHFTMNGLQKVGGVIRSTCPMRMWSKPPALHSVRCS